MLFMLAGWVSSFVFTLIIYTLTVSFGDIGKALAVVFLVIQIAGAGGTFPVEVVPEFSRAFIRSCRLHTVSTPCARLSQDPTARITGSTC